MKNIARNYEDYEEESYNSYNRIMKIKNTAKRNFKNQ